MNRERVASPLPEQVPPGRLATLSNEYSASDGDQFPYFFRQYGLGPVVGTRTWGGVRGLSGALRLLDGGFITVPKDALIDPDGRQILENQCTTPDVEVENTPADYVSGHDRQLEAGVKVLLQALDHPTNQDASAPSRAPTPKH